MARTAYIISAWLVTATAALAAGVNKPVAVPGNAKGTGTSAAPAGSDGIVKTDGADIGVTIMGAIVQKSSDDNVALIKEQTGVVKAVKKDHVILDRYKVIAVHAEYMELVTRDNKKYWVYQDKFSGVFAPKAGASTAANLSGVADQYKEDGFERVKGKITMTGMYRDKLIKEDLAKVLMQATAEPYAEGGSIIGFKMSQIDDGSIYAQAGIQNGDVITGINGTELTSVAGSIALLRSLKGADHVELEIKRNGASQKISVDVN
jgi:type II secretory pathway component PulC